MTLYSIANGEGIETPDIQKLELQLWTVFHILDLSYSPVLQTLPWILALVDLVVPVYLFKPARESHLLSHNDQDIRKRVR